MRIKTGETTRILTVPLSGISCASCISNIETVLAGLDGVVEGKVNLANHQATISYNPRRIELKEIATALEKAGYPMDLQETRIAIGGLRCASCVLNVEKFISEIEGVVSVDVNYAAATGVIKHIGVANLGGEIESHLMGSGYEVTISNGGSEEADPLATEIVALRMPLITSLIAAVITMGLMGLEHLQMIHADSSIFAYVQFALTTVVYFWAGKQFHLGLIHSIRRRSADMNTLISVGTSAAYWFSVVALFFPRVFYSPDQMPEYYFDSAVMIIALILLGRYFEAKAKSRSSTTISKLLKARPENALLISGSAERMVASSILQPGNLVRVKPGERIPADGRVVRGEGAVDESMITGESVPVDKGIDAGVIGGTVSISGSFDFEVTAQQGDSRLNRIAEMVMDAIGSKPRIQRLVDRVASIFVPIVIGLAAVTLLGWLLAGATFPFALKNVIAILIIACPCALGLATPMSIMVGVGKAASMGILFKSGETLENIGKLTTLYFDKTGTLTEGKFEVVRIGAIGITEENLLYLAGSVERRSEHPLAKAIVEYAIVHGIILDDCDGFVSLTGAGASGVVDGKKVLLGTSRLMYSRDIPLAERMDEINSEVGQGRTLVFLAVDGKLAGYVSLADAIKVEAQMTIKEVTALGITPALITGDNRATAAAVARKMGITEVSAELLPEQKLEVIRKRKESGEVVGMVGDGINDVPALALADVGIALTSGTEFAVESASVTLTGKRIDKVPTVIRLARATVRNVKQNLFWAFFYNVAAIPLAAGVFYPKLGIQLTPAIAALAMSCSSIFVVTNALRLRRFK